MKIKMFLSPPDPGHLKKSDHRRRRRCFPFCLRISTMVWAFLLAAVTYLLFSLTEVDKFGSAMRKVKLRSSSTQHDHEDTTNSGPHDLQEDALDIDNLDLQMDDLPTIQPIMEPPALDATMEEQTPYNAPTSVASESLANPKIHVAFIDTPPEERRLLKRTRKPIMMDVNEDFKEALNGTAVSNAEEDGRRKWATTNVTFELSNNASSSRASAMPTVTQKSIQMRGEQTVTEPTGKSFTAPFKKSGFTDTNINFGYDDDMSRNIGVQRNLPDGRHDSCKSKRYPNFKSKVSVVISVFNEAWHVLLRTIHSVVDRSPANLLKEVIVVDDYSDKKLTYMKEELDKYVKRWDNVKVFRNEKREGLIWSRTDAASTKASGDIIIFLDSHVEVNKGWLEPLVQRIERDWHTVAVPVLDTIVPQTFRYAPKPQILKTVEAFRWDLQPFDIPSPKSSEGEAGPITVPMASHGQFAVSKRFFDLLGGFDPRLELFGGENLELSFKAWMCGGRVELVPCSRIGHVARGRLPSLRTEVVEKKIRKNLLRVAKTWMDEHSVFYENSKNSLRQLDYGDITGRVQLRKGLNCKSFDWYLQHVYPQLFNPKGMVIADGEIRSSGMDGSLCLDAMSTVSAVARMFPCHGVGGNQRWWYTTKGEIRRYGQCLDFWGKQIQFFPCHGQQGNQFWLYLSDLNQFKHVNTEKCMTVVSQDAVEMEPCEENRFNQQWILANFNSSAYEEVGFGN